MLGEIINDDEISLIVKEPLKVILSYARPGGFPIITMHRYSFFDDCERVIFKKAHVVTYNQVKKGVDLYYINSLKNQKGFINKFFLIFRITYRTRSNCSNIRNSKRFSYCFKMTQGFFSS